MPWGLYEELVDAADAGGKSVSEYVREAVVEKLRREKAYREMGKEKMKFKERWVTIEI
jgi:hypothetical protein